ncbi:MAG: GDSL-type esterase/lipase family protein [Mycobacteriales bacterium]
MSGCRRPAPGPRCSPPACPRPSWFRSPDRAPRPATSSCSSWHRRSRPGRSSPPSLVGLNDVLRSSSCDVEADLDQVVAALRSVGAFVLAVRLHDPVAQLRLPAPLRRAVHRRVAAVNEAVDRVAERHGAPLLDLAAISGLRRREAWAVDRLHPGPAGHRAIAAAAGTALGLELGAPGVPEAAPGLLDEMAWVVRHGLLYAAVHGRRMVPGVLSLR